MSASEFSPDMHDLPVAGGAESPLHGFQGDRGRQPAATLHPPGLTVALSRESGARGGTIARRVAKKIGWQLYNQELLDYVSQDGMIRDNLLANLSQTAPRWAEDRLAQLIADGQMTHDDAVVHLARTILAAAAQGDVVMLGRGAGYVLPRESTLNVRIVAPLSDRIAYMAQWSRQSAEQAAETVRLRDEGRSHFVQTHFRRAANDIYQYDLLLNSSALGEDLCVELIVLAAQAKQRARLEAANR